MAGLLARLGLGRPELRAWAMYDWANSAFWTTVIVAVFPPFFSEYAAAGLTPAVATSRFAWGTTLAVTIVALMAPILGAIADHRPLKKRMLAVFLVVAMLVTPAAKRRQGRRGPETSSQCRAHPAAKRRPEVGQKL